MDMNKKFTVGKRPDDLKPFSVRISEALIGQLDSIATKTNRSRNEVMTLCIEYALENFFDELMVAEKDAPSNDKRSEKGPASY